MKIESVEVIPMNKESIFEETSWIEDEDYGYTDDYKQWAERKSKLIESRDCNYGAASLYEHEICKRAKIYMMHPVIKIGTKIYESRSRRFNSIGEIDIDFDKIALYDIDKNMSTGKIVVRFCEL